MNWREEMDIDYYEKHFSNRDRRNAIVYWVVFALVLAVAVVVMMVS